MGIGMTGVLQATEEQRDWLKPCYQLIREFDEVYSMDKKIPRSVKLTTCKPSGTLSILGHCTSGIHPGFARYYIRRIRVASESKLINIAKDHGYHVEYVQNFDGTNDYTTQVISFPYSLPESTILAEDCSAVKQMEYVKWLQSIWSDNSVSVTVYYRKEELPEIKEWLRKNYNDSVKTISFLLHSDHGFKQAPLEKITQEQYEEMVKNTRPIKSVKGICHTAQDEKFASEGECLNGVCPMK
jgi:ribonucleoside-diphosphate reductase alpha chain/ribonucleoside-triphosphate reductase